MQGTKIVDASHDQDTTDLHKCVAYICDWAQNLDKSDVSWILSVSSALNFTLIFLPNIVLASTLEMLLADIDSCSVFYWPEILIFAKLAASMFLYLYSN